MKLLVGRFVSLSAELTLVTHIHIHVHIYLYQIKYSTLQITIIAASSHCDGPFLKKKHCARTSIINQIQNIVIWFILRYKWVLKIWNLICLMIIWDRQIFVHFLFFILFIIYQYSNKTSVMVCSGPIYCETKLLPVQVTDDQNMTDLKID